MGRARSDRDGVNSGGGGGINRGDRFTPTTNIYIYIYRSTSTSHANSLQDENKLSSLDSINVSVTIIALRFLDITFFILQFVLNDKNFFYRFRIGDLFFYGLCIFLDGI